MNEYRDFGEYFENEESEIDVDVKCPNPDCEHVDTATVSYDGVLETHEREMGNEKTHSWSGEYICPKCGKESSVEHKKWEYPEGVINDEETKCNKIFFYSQ
ncbi:MAG: hypothetical protein ACFFDN_16985 [Candidatus Hodarchaeota archaeon]